MLTQPPVPVPAPSALRAPRRLLRTAGLLAAAVALGACTVSGGTSGEADDDTQQEGGPAVTEPSPAASSSAALTPLPDVPRDSRPVGTDVFSLQAPAEYTESTRPGPAGVDMLVLSGEADEPGAVAEVVAFSTPDVDFDAELDVLLTTLRELRRAEDVTSDTVEWPDADRAHVVSWTQETAVGGGTVVEAFTQLSVQREDGTGATVLAVAPEGQVADSGVVEVLRTFRLAGA